jgi:hypothetical protein
MWLAIYPALTLTLWLLEHLGLRQLALPLRPRPHRRTRASHGLRTHPGAINRSKIRSASLRR